jgi:hypothetical protein
MASGHLVQTTYRSDLRAALSEAFAIVIFVRATVDKSAGRSAAIDLHKLRARLRVIGEDQVFYMLDEALELLPRAALQRIVGRYISLDDVRADPAASRRTLLEDVRAFDAAARAGDYYQSFNVNSKNCMDKSAGTRSFIADFSRLLGLCVAASGNSAAADVRMSLEILFALHRYIDECNDDVIFFADEAGAWQIGVDWRTVLPAWFRCLAKTVEPVEYARLVREAIDDFDPHARVQHLAAARQAGSPLQRRALASRRPTPRGRLT